MPIEESLARIASALEVIADKLCTPPGGKTEPREPAKFTECMPGVASDTRTGELEKKPATSEKIKAPQKEQAEKPKFDFNKEIRAPFVELLNLARDKASIGAKGATQLARKLLLEYTTDPNSPLSAKTLPEDKYEEFLTALSEHTERIRNPEGE